MVIYRPPKMNKNKFITEIRRTLHLGDCNINILQSELNSTANEYLNTLSELGLQCGIQDVTREAIVAGRRQASCLDHIFVRNATAASLHSYTVMSKVADHYLIGLMIEVPKQ
ncbi:unnamed protein product, partial [Leptidea sinapis]